MTTTQQIEYERKFDVPDGWTTPPRVTDSAGVAWQIGRAKRLVQTATYLDTPDLRLLRAKCTLRRRTGGSDAGWHLKTPASAGARREMHAPLGRSAARVPAELWSEVEPIAGGLPLVPVAVLRTRRAERPVSDASGALVALICDDAVQASVAVGIPDEMSWREVEVEAGGDGGPEQVAAIGWGLVDAGLAPCDRPSKLGHALSAPLAAVVEREASDRVTAGDTVIAYVAAQVAVIQRLEGAVREDRPDAVHKMRVATRRLRSTLKTFRPVFDRTVSDPLRGRVAALTAALGGPRDAEVMQARLVESVEALEPELVTAEAATRVHEMLSQRHRDAHAALVRVLDSRGHDDLLGELAGLVAAPPWAAGAGRRADKVLPGLVARACDKVVEMATVADESPDAAAREEAVHDVRKLAKAARYAAEATGGQACPRAAGLADAWTDVQEALGEHQDAVVAKSVIGELRAAAWKAGEDTFTYGVLTERENARIREVERTYPALLKAARKAAQAAA